MKLYLHFSTHLFGGVLDEAKELWNLLTILTGGLLPAFKRVIMVFRVGVLVRHAIVGSTVMTCARNTTAVMNTIFQRNYTKS
jgi:hypothetical protein